MALYIRIRKSAGWIPDEKSRQSELEEALDGQATSVIFPADLGDIDHWVAFGIHEHEFRRDSDFPIETALHHIFLPLPAALRTVYSQDYSGEGIGLGGLLGSAAVAASGGGVSSIIESVKQASGSMGDLGAKTMHALSGDAAGAIGALAGALTGNIGGAIVAGGAGLLAGQAIKAGIATVGLSANPYMSVLYNSPTLRQHNFQWKFIPRSAQESRDLQRIIYLFKYHSSPSSTKNPHFFNYPEQFEIDFHYPKYLFNIGPSVLESIDVNYHSEGVPLYHSLGEHDVEKTPVSVEISLQFKETRFVTKETIEKHQR